MILFFWSSHFPNSIFKKMLKNITDRKIWIYGGIFCILVLLGSSLTFWDKNFYRKATLLSVLTTGFSEIAFQVVILLSFQIIYGFLFYKLGLILTSFMIGLSIGGWFITKKITSYQR